MYGRAAMYLSNKYELREVSSGVSPMGAIQYLKNKRMRKEKEELDQFPRQLTIEDYLERKDQK